MFRPACVAAVATLLCLAPAAGAQSPSLIRASVSSTSAEGDNSSFDPVVSANGRWVAFASRATNLVDGDTNAFVDVFLRDTLRGTTTRLSTGAGGVQANKDSSTFPPGITDDGRQVLFESSATNLASPATGLYLADTTTGAVRSLPIGAGYEDPGYATISRDGSRYVFRAKETASGRNDVLAGDVGTGSVRVMNRTPGGGAPNNGATRPAVSGDGRWMTFSSIASDLVTGDSNGESDVFAAEVATGALQRASVSSGNGQSNDQSTLSALSGDGCIIGFQSFAGNLVSPAVPAGTVRVYGRNRCTGQTYPVSVDGNGAPAEGLVPAVSSDGCQIAFVLSGAFLRDTCAGTTTRLDVSTNGVAGNSSPNWVTLSGTGRYAAISSTATTLVPADGNARQDAFLRDRATNRKPGAELTVTATGRTVAADATASGDEDGPTVTATIAWGDGTPDSTGLQATHAYARGGTYAVTVTVTDSDGETSTKAVPVTLPDPAPAGGTAPAGGGGTPTGPATTPKPALRGVRLGRSSFRVVPKGKQPSGNRGTTLSLTLSTAATVRLRFDRAVPGRRKGRKCKAGGRRGKRCTVFRSAGRVSRDLRAGAGTVPITGRIGRKALKPGRYRLRVDATGDGGTSAVQTLSLTVKG